MLAGFFLADLGLAQDPVPVMIRDLNTYDVELTSQAVLPTHPLVGVEVTFDAMVVAYPKNSGLASLVEGVPGRIHVFVIDVNAADLGPDGMGMQFVVEGAQRTTLEALLPGDVIRAVGTLGFFGNTGQFNATDVEDIGNVFDDEEYEDLAQFLEPVVIPLSEINIPSPTNPGQFRWNAENYTKYINRYVKIEQAEIINRIEANTGRPWFISGADGVIVTSNDTSLRYRNDRTNYADALGYNWRRLDDTLDGPFVPPLPGTVIDLSGFVVVNTFNPGAFDESGVQSTLKIAPWDDGVLWIGPGTDPANRIEPDGWPNDLQILGFAPILSDYMRTPSGSVVNSTDAVSVSIDAFLPDEDYTMESVTLTYTAIPSDQDDADPVTVDMTGAGDTYSYTFDLFDAFTNVSFTITATAETPDGIQTRARQSDAFYVTSAGQTAAPIISPGSGTYENVVTISMSTASPDSTIYYTLDGTEPSDASTQYTGPFSITESATVKAIAYSAGNTPSPVVTREYTIEIVVTEVSTLAQLRAGELGTTTYKYTGEAVVTHTRTFRNHKYLMDDTGGIQIDDQPGTITSEYNRGDVMTGVQGTLSQFNALTRFVPSLDPGPSQGTQTITPVPLTLAEVTISQHESMLVKIENVTFVSQGTFTAGANFQITDPSLPSGQTRTFRTDFSEADYIGTTIPEQPVNITVLVGNFNNNIQYVARDLGDFEPYTSSPIDGRPAEFKLAQNYPNPFNPTTNIGYTLAHDSDVTLTVYDILGRRVATLVNARQQSAGTYNVVFDATRLASGTYIYRLETADYVSVKKMMLIK